MFYFFRRYLRTNKAVTSWTKRSTFRTLYGATSEIIHLLCTVTFVMNIYVMIVRLNILQINPKTTRWLTFHLKGGAIYYFSRVYKTLQKNLWTALWTMWHSTLLTVYFLWSAFKPQKHWHFGKPWKKERRYKEWFTRTCSINFSQISIDCWRFLQPNSLSAWELRENIISSWQTRWRLAQRDWQYCKGTEIQYQWYKMQTVNLLQCKGCRNQRNNFRNWHRNC